MKYDKSKIVFCDTETTGLYPELGHEVWEIATIHWSDHKTHWIENTWRVRPRLELADPIALSINGYYERYMQESFNNPEVVAGNLGPLLSGKHLVGAIPSFDALFLDRFLRRHSQCPTWHYHVIDIEAMVIGWLARETFFNTREDSEIELPLPWKSDWMFEQLGLADFGAEEHTALGDTRKVKEVWERMVGDG